MTYHTYYLYSLPGFTDEIGYANSLSKIEFVDIFHDLNKLKPYPDPVKLDKLLTK